MGGVRGALISVHLLPATYPPVSACPPDESYLRNAGCHSHPRVDLTKYPWHTTRLLTSRPWPSDRAVARRQDALAQQGFQLSALRQLSVVPIRLKGARIPHSAVSPGSGYGRLAPHNHPLLAFRSRVILMRYPRFFPSQPSRFVTFLPGEPRVAMGISTHVCVLGPAVFATTPWKDRSVLSAHSMVALPQLIDRPIDVLGGYQIRSDFFVLLVVSMPHPPPNECVGHSRGHASDHTYRPR